MSHLDRLEQLGKLRASGVLSEEEFQREKARILAERNAPPRRAEPVPPYLRDTPPTAREPMPDSGMAWAILTTLFCFFPFGVVAIDRLRGSSSRNYYTYRGAMQDCRMGDVRGGAGDGEGEG